MRIAIPVAEGMLNLHFGHCHAFALIDVDLESKAIVATREVEAPKHEPGVLPLFLATHGANLIIAGGMGQRAQEHFKNHGIEVICGAPVKSPQALVKEYLEGSLVAGDNVCDH
ncbi:MAG: NifB/NifX family molybdenum-iron cluster-binding protein [Sphaerochaetaceae bacterium]|jgi:predicted Fe-Mo cluster-binding NifX family protein|nr:NifB/NifX family molybdenum-iron cluster-binding protein [Sphaerochaetaceae bacterium]